MCTGRQRRRQGKRLCSPCRRLNDNNTHINPINHVSVDTLAARGEATPSVHWRAIFRPRRHEHEHETGGDTLDYVAPKIELLAKVERRFRCKSSQHDVSAITCSVLDIPEHTEGDHISCVPLM